MNDLKRYGIIIAVVLAVFVLNFNISGERGDVKSFRGAQLEDDVFYPLMAENFNTQTINLFVDGKSYTNAGGKIYVDPGLNIMVAEDLLQNVFECSSAIYDKNRLIIKKFDDTITYDKEKNQIEVNGKKENVICPLTIYRGDYYVGAEDLAHLLGYTYNFSRQDLEINMTNKRAGEMFVPKHFDLREEGRAAEIRDQGTESTCWAYASAASMESFLLPEEKAKISVDAMVNYDAFSGDLSQGGEYTKALAYLLSWNGPVLNDEDGTVFKHLQEVQIPTYKNIDKIKEDIFLYGGVQSAIFCTDLSKNIDSKYYNKDKFAYCYDGKQKPNHDVVIIGWDDSFEASNFPTNPIANGAFICQNSWGNNFGEDGVFYVSYFDTNLCTQSVVYTKIEDVTNYDTIYQSDLCGWVGNVGFGTDEAFCANIFTADEDSWIDAAGFYATGPQTYYEVYMIPDYTGVSDLAKRGVRLASGQLADAGYYTVDFEHHMEVSAGSKFAIGVFLKTEKSEHPIAIEYAADDLTEDCIITDGEGYISEDAVHWESIEQTANANLCVKAYGRSW